MKYIPTIVRNYALKWVMFKSMKKIQKQLENIEESSYFEYIQQNH